MNPEELLQKRLTLTRNYRSAMDQAHNHSAALSSDRMFRISPLIAYGQLSNRFNAQIVGSGQALRIGQPDPKGRVKDLEKVIQDMGSDYAYGRCKEIAQNLPNAEIVYWSSDQWDFAVDGHKEIGSGRINLSDIPMTTQVWFFDKSTKPGYFDQFDSGSEFLRDCSVEAIIVHPDGAGKVDAPAGLCATIIFKHPVTKERYGIMLPLLSSWARVSTLEPMDDKLQRFFSYPKDLVSVEGSLIQADDHGLVLQAVPMPAAQAILSALLYMQESYVMTETRAYSTKGATTRGGKPEKHHGKITVVNLRKRVYQGKETQGESSRSYSCQFRVRTHWRHYKKQLKSGKWMTRIPPYIKGPEGAPLKTGEKIYRVTS